MHLRGNHFVSVENEIRDRDLRPARGELAFSLAVLHRAPPQRPFHPSQKAEGRSWKGERQRTDMHTPNPVRVLQGGTVGSQAEQSTQDRCRKTHSQPALSRAVWAPKYYSG